MCWRSILAVSVFPVLAVSVTLPQPQDTNNPSQRPAVSPALLSAENSSATCSNTSLGSILKIRCDSLRYGRNLNVGSCRNVFNFIAQDDTQTVFAERGAVQSHDLGLPFRITSNDARCYVQPILAEGAVTAQASPHEVGNAANTLFQQCVVKGGVGGIAGDIGGDNNLDVVIASYKPDVRCNSYSGPPWSSCVEIFGSMSVDKNRHMFGHLPDQRVRTGLPITYSSADRRCMVTIDIVGEPTGLSWYEVWEAVVALASTCARGKEKCGKANGLGLGRNVFLRLSDEHLGLNTLTLGNQSLSLLTSD